METDSLEDFASTGDRERGYGHTVPVNRELRQLTRIFPCRSRDAHLPGVGTPSASASAGRCCAGPQPAQPTKRHRCRILFLFAHARLMPQTGGPGKPVLQRWPGAGVQGLMQPLSGLRADLHGTQGRTVREQRQDGSTLGWIMPSFQDGQLRKRPTRLRY